MRIVKLFILLLTPLASIYAQRGKDGPRTVTAANTIVNEYTNVTSTPFAGSTAIQVASSSLNANGRFTGPLAPGDLIMIYEVRGVFINGSMSGTIGLPNDTTWGRPVDYYATGVYQFAQVLSTPTADTIVIDCPLNYSYYMNTNGFFRAIVVRVPRYTTLTINGGGVLTCDDWNGTTGGVLAVEVENNMIINAGGIMDANGKGFRGGSLVGDNLSAFGVNNMASTDATYGAEKGEGAAGYQAVYDNWGGRYGRGAAANGGGGGCAHNGGGGGGANAAANIYNWKGYGIPDLTGTNYTNAWNLENVIIAGLTNANSAGGGRGGYSFSSSNQNALSTGPGASAWGGDNRNREAAGLGGRPLDYSTGRLFFGGGGGAGDQNNSGGGIGGDGGGLIYAMVYGNVSGSGTIRSNGTNGSNGQGGTSFPTGIDAGGGGGAGGVVIVNAVGGVANTLTITTNGGNGGNQVVNPVVSTNEAEGPGGGGGGGYIGISSGAPTVSSTGGNNGTTNSQSLTEFLPNGAMRGCQGITNGVITNFTIAAANVSICSGNTAALSASLSGTVPSGTSITWYTASVGGTALASGANYTTPVLTGTTTYYVGTCPGTYRIPVVVTVNPQPTVSITATTPVCASSSAFNLTASPSGGTWSGTGITNAANGTFNPSVSGTGTFTIVYNYTDANGCSNSDTEPLVVNPGGNATINSVAPVCTSTSPFNMTAATGGGTWTGTGITNAANGTFNPSVSGAGTFVITYSITGSCISTDQETVTVNATPAATINSVSAVCAGSAAFNLTAASAGGTWSGTGITNTANGTFDPAVSGAGTFTVTYSFAGSCPASDQEVVTVNAVSNATINSVAAVCAGSAPFNLTAASSGGTWSGTGITSATNGTFNPSTAGSFTVTYSFAGSCPSSDNEVVTVNAQPVASINSTSPVCAGSAPFNLTATQSGGTWSGTGITNAANGTFNPATAGTFTITYSFAGSCPASDQEVVTVNAVSNATINSVPAVCAGSSPFNLTAATAGGTWSGTGITNTTNGTFNPSTAGSFTVTYSFAGSCPSSDQEVVTVNAQPDASINPVAAVCASSPAFNLSAATSGGTWSGTGITNTTNGTFDPAVSGTGNFSIIYTISGACADDDTLQVLVSSSFNSTINSVAPVCSNASAFTLTAADPGGSWSGTGITNASAGTFDPSVAGAGSFVVTYSLSGSCGSSDTETISILQAADASITAANPVCENSSAFNMSAAQTGGTWSGTGITDANNGTFDPSSAGSGTFSVIYTIGGQCGDDDTAQVIVNALPDATITNVAAVCNNSAAFNLTAATSGGNWAGTGIADSSNGTFDPGINGPGTYTVSYTVNTGCTAVDTSVINVIPNSDASITNAANVCDNAGAFSLLSAEAGGTWSGTGVIDSLAGTFDPAVSGTGTFSIVYTIGGQCGDADTSAITVSQSPDATISSVPSLCSSSPGTNLTAATTGGTWSGAGVTDSVVGIFDPTVSGPGTFTVSYLITGTCPAADTVLVTVIQNSNAAINPNQPICINSGTLLLSPVQFGGTWSGTGITDTVMGVFDPVISGAGTFIIYYSIGGQCGDMDSSQVTVVNFYDASINNVAAVCSSTGAFNLTAADSGGTWSGTGITSASAGTFDPSVSGTGTFTVTYVVGGSCGSIDTALITVMPVPDATISSPGIICSNAGTITLSAASAGGTWTGTGITNGANGTFDPAVSGAGTFQVIYTISGSCADDDTISVTVSNTISSAINAAGPFCNNDAAVTLTAANSGGTWSGTGITGATTGVFDPSAAGAGTQTISYSISGNCGSTSTVSIVVNPSADASITTTAPQTFCANQTAVNFSSSQSGGTWSGTGITSSANGTFDPAVSGAGAFQIIYAIAGTCGDADTLAVTVNAAPAANILNSPQTGCTPLCINFSALSSANYAWSYGDGSVNDSTQSASHCFTTAGSFTVQLSAASGSCAASDSVVITVNQTPTAGFTSSPGLVVGPGETFTFNNTSSSANSYFWFLNDINSSNDTSSLTSPTYAYSDTGTYCVLLYAYGNGGCYDSSITCVLVINDIVVQIPNIFTPNGDGTNEVFSIKSDGLKDLRCIIFDRWGLKMAEFSGINGYWDGTTINGAKASNGTYYYLLEYTDIKYDTFKTNGFLQLIGN
jgi:gliding motility-associated-like protein